jgi:hypothetical protein
MRKPASVQRSAPNGRRVAGSGSGEDSRGAEDRGYLLRRKNAFPFPRLTAPAEGIRLRRERQVCASFSSIRSLARGTRS